MRVDVRSVLEQVKSGTLSVDEAWLKLKMAPFEDIDFAKIDHHRRVRQGEAEVIFGEGKSADQIAAICTAMQKSGQETILITRLSPEIAGEVSVHIDLCYHEQARVGIVGPVPVSTREGYVLVATGGTGDIPVAEEAALTAEVFGSRVVRLYDVGVAGLHRLLAHIDEIMNARVIIAAAGMEGALASVIGGLADCPVIAVPTSIGYGASYEGISALLAMLNSCAAGVAVVNIDNGFGAGVLASRIHREAKA